jgi:hypothetical protein
MSDGLDIIIVDDDLSVCKMMSEIIRGFYSWADIIGFNDVNEALLQFAAAYRFLRTTLRLTTLLRGF